jgi:hypothetical protein
VETAFEVAEEDRHGLNPFFVGEVLETVLLDLVRGNTILPLLYCL